jgi:hypothetical protein
MADHPMGPIRSMRLQNLRRFVDTGELRFAPINFLFGKNSSGKTTLLRAPLLLKQLVNERSLVGGVPFSGPYVDFGSYPEAVYNGERTRDIIMSFVIDTEAAQRRFPRSTMREVAEYGPLRVTASLHWNAKGGQAQFNSVEIYSDRAHREVLKFRRLGPDRIRVEDASGPARTATGTSELSFASLVTLPFDFEPGDRRAVDLEFLAYAINAALINVTDRTIHVGPLRDMPERAYRIDQLSTSGGPTEHVVGMLVSNSNAVPLVSTALRRLGIAKQVDVVQPAPGYAGVVLSDVNSTRKDNLADVGFGASQVLPIIARLALAPPGSFLLIEQPELHLHPEVQGELAEVMIDLAVERNLNLFIESHSENMLLRLRRKIANGGIDASAIKVFVTDRGTVKQAKLDNRGSIDMSAFPPGFFEEEWFEAMGIVEGAARRG